VRSLSLFLCASSIIHHPSSVRLKVTLEARSDVEYRYKVGLRLWRLLACGVRILPKNESRIINWTTVEQPNTERTSLPTSSTHYGGLHCTVQRISVPGSFLLNEESSCIEQPETYGAFQRQILYLNGCTKYCKPFTKLWRRGVCGVSATATYVHFLVADKRRTTKNMDEPLKFSSFPWLFEPLKIGSFGAFACSEY
jgi:hypothetical protein